MKAAVVSAFDVPPDYGEFEEPVARAGEKAVTITAAGLHQIVKSLANGTHYGSTGELPFVPGVDGVGRLEDGSRVFVGSARSPFGTFAERGIAPDWMCVPLPDGLDDATAAGIANPGMSSWVALKARAKFVAGESVLVLGATGVAGQLAVQVAKRSGARRVIAAGRNVEALERLKTLGGDAVVALDQSGEAVVEAFRQAIAVDGLDVVLDYVWGEPAERLLQAMAHKGLRKATSRVRYIQIGSTAGTEIRLPAAVLRSSALEMMGSGFGSASMEQIRAAIGEFFAVAAEQPFDFKVKSAPLSEVAALWNEKEQGQRLVFVP